MAVYTGMIPLDNEHVKGLTKPTELQNFQAEYVQELKRARDSIFIEICKEFKQGLDHRFVANRYFSSSRTITKEKLGVWLESACHVLDQYCIPWLQKAAPLVQENINLKEEIQTLRQENVSYQKRVIELQSRLIEKQDEQLNSVKSTVEKELKTYSSVVESTVKSQMETYSSTVAKSCSSAFAPKRLQAAVRKVEDKKERSHNVVIYGLDEHQNEQLQSRVETILVEIGEKPVVKDCCRVGRNRENAIRPVKFSLSSQAHVAQVLKNARKLRTLDGYSSVYICPDRCLEERKAYKKLVEEVKKKRDTETDKVHYILRDKIVSYSKNCKSDSSGNEEK